MYVYSSEAFFLVTTVTQAIHGVYKLGTRTFPRVITVYPTASKHKKQ